MTNWYAYFDLPNRHGLVVAYQGTLDVALADAQKIAKEQHGVLKKVINYDDKSVAYSNPAVDNNDGVPDSGY